MQAEVRRHVVRTSDLYPSRPSSIYLGPGPHGPHPPPLVVPAGRQAGVGRNTTAGRTEHRIQCCRPATFMPMATTVPPPRTRTHGLCEQVRPLCRLLVHARTQQRRQRPALPLPSAFSAWIQRSTTGTGRTTRNERFQVAGAVCSPRLQRSACSRTVRSSPNACMHTASITCRPCLLYLSIPRSSVHPPSPSA
jgi:hypothetical protein